MLLGYEWRFVAGLALTAAIALTSLTLALALGLAGAAAKTSANRWARRCAGIYTTAVRGIPELVFILLVYFEAQKLLNFLLSDADASSGEVLQISPFWAGAVAIGLFYGAYMTETFRGALLAVPDGQREAGLAVGLSRRAVFWRVIFPQMLRHALPGIRNNWQVLLKATALVSVIGLSSDMMAVANQAKSATRLPFLFYGAAACGYLLLTTASGSVFDAIDRYVRRGTA